MTGILGKKIGMTRYFDPTGNTVAATLIEAGPCTVVQVKTKERDGYDAVQLGFQEKKEKRVNKPMMGHFNRIKSKPFRVLKEFRGEMEVKEGDEVKVDIFKEGDMIHVTGLTKGRGFAGVMKRHGFHGGPKSHGQSDRERRRDQSASPPIRSA